MIDVEEIEKHLPYYLTDKARHSLLQELKSFPENLDGRIFTSYLKDKENIFQGDGFQEFLFVNLPDTTIGKMSAMVLSNTCDIDLTNERLISKRIVYAPIFKLDKYRKALISEHENKEETQQSIDSHIEAIKKQKVTDIFFLPQCEVLKDESIVMFDRLNNLPVGYLSPGSIKQKRLFTLSDYGFYLFLIKLSIHFSRVKEEVNRTPEDGKCA